MTIYIPLVPILWGIAVYLIIGALLFVPLVYWQDRFISGNRPVWESVHAIKGLIISMLAWPPILGFTIREEVRYRRKGYL